MRPIDLKTRRFFTCPNGCAHAFEIEHLFAMLDEPSRAGHDCIDAGPWYCGDCGQGWTVIACRDGRVTAGEHTPHDAGHTGRVYRQKVTLEIPPQKEPIRFVLAATRFTPAIDRDVEEFFYEESTCPVNWLRQVREISIGDDTDPHWLVKLVDVEAEKDSA